MLFRSRRSIPYLTIQEEGSHHRRREPVMGEHEARAFYWNSQDDGDLAFNA